MKITILGTIIFDLNPISKLNRAKNYTHLMMRQNKVLFWLWINVYKKENKNLQLSWLLSCYKKLYFCVLYYINTTTNKCIIIWDFSLSKILSPTIKKRKKDTNPNTSFGSFKKLKVSNYFVQFHNLKRIIFQ